MLAARITWPLQVRLTKRRRNSSALQPGQAAIVCFDPHFNHFMLQKGLTAVVCRLKSFLF